MNNFKILAAYELKKLLSRKITWIMLFVMMMISAVMPFMSLLGSSTDEETYYEHLMADRSVSLTLSGKEINDAFIQEIQLSNQRLPDNLHNFFATLSVHINDSTVTENEIYKARRELVREEWQALYLTGREQQYLESQEAKIKIPFVYQYFESYSTMAAIFYTLGIMQTLFIAVCIPAIFADEHHLKMDQLVLSSKNGKKMTFGAKIFVGSVFSLAVTIILTLLSAIPAFCIYGVEGISAQVQLLLPHASALLNMGQLILIILSLCMVKAVLETVIAMVFAERFRSSVATMAILVGGMVFVSAFEIPHEYRFLSQLWNCLPNNMVAVWGVLDSRLISVLGHFFSQWQIVPAIYLVIAAIAGWYGCKIYSQYQVR